MGKAELSKRIKRKEQFCLKVTFSLCPKRDIKISVFCRHKKITGVHEKPSDAHVKQPGVHMRN